VRPSSPPQPPSSSRALDFDDSVTQYRPLHGPPSFGGAPPSSRGAGPISVPPPLPPESVPAMHGYGVPAAPGSLPPSSLAAPASAPPGHYPTLPLAQQPGTVDRKLALGLLAAAAVLLPLVIALLFLRTSTTGQSMNELTEPRIAAPNVPMPIVDPPAVTPAKPSAVVIVSPTTQAAPAITPTPVQQNAAAGAPPKAAAAAAPPKPQPKAAAPAPAPQPAPAPEPSPQATGAMGTLVAVAIGGTCAFSVNGASKGSGSSTKVQLKPGTYSVACKPSGGAAKSKSVTVKSGETAMASFKL
jgi:serine/threonine-protein kinase